MRTPRRLIPVSLLALAATAIAILALPATGAAQTDRAPVVTAPATASTAENTLLTILASAADPDGDAITSFTASGSAITAGGTFTSNATNTSGTFSWTPSFAQAGSWDVTFAARNTLTGTATTMITVGGPDRAPVVNTPSTAQAIIRVPMSFTVSAGDPDGDAIASLTASGTAITAGGTFTSNATHTAGTFAWTAGFGQGGSYSAVFTAANALSGSATTSITVCACDRAPVVTAPATASGLQNVLLTFTVFASDPDGDAITSFIASGTAITAGGTFSADATHTSGTFSWTPGFNDAGVYSVTFTASNALSGTATTSISVCLGCSRAPVVTAPATVQGSRNLLITFTVSATDPDGTAITSLTAAPLPSGATFTANGSNTFGTFDWTPTQNGTFNVTFTAANDLSSSATTQITIGSGDRAPVVSAPASVSASAGSLLTFTVSASDPDGDAITALTASGSAVDAGGTFTAGAGNTSGTFTWTPASGQSGTFIATFRATNALQGTASTQIYVSPNPLARAFTLGSNKTIRLNSSKPLWCAFVEPLGGSFSVLDIDLASVVLRSTGTGSVPEIPANILKSVVVSDADNNDIQDVEFCFTKDNLRLLFGNLNARNTVNATIAGRLMNLTPFSASIQIDVIAGGNSLAASISPNPLNPSGTISFTAPSAGVGRVRIFDASGRLVRTLAEAPLAAGRHDLPFDVRDASGSRPASGVYFYRVDVAGEFATGRFVLTR